MGYIIKSPTGGGGGNATAANQQKQIDQLADLSAYPSVLKDNADLSVFKDNNGDSVFTDTGASVFIASGKSVGDRAYFINENLSRSIRTTTSTTVTSFTSTTLAGVATLLETFLQANPSIYIVNISFSSGGVTQHDVLLTYNV
jgi:hypothetical protein